MTRVALFTVVIWLHIATEFGPGWQNHFRPGLVDRVGEKISVSLADGFNGSDRDWLDFEVSL
jgi:hypothetical protein